MKDRLLVTVAFVLGGVCCGLSTRYAENQGRQTVGLYACDRDLSACIRLVWTNSTQDCRAVKHDYERAPIAGDQLVCVRRAAFEGD